MAWSKPMNGALILLVDAIVNLALGVLLLLSVPFSGELTAFLGVPGIVSLITCWRNQYDCPIHSLSRKPDRCPWTVPLAYGYCL